MFDDDKNEDRKIIPPVMGVGPFFYNLLLAILGLKPKGSDEETK